jgi:hypothetical protein
MASEMRRVAKALVDGRAAGFESRHSLDESIRRLCSAIESGREDRRGIDGEAAPDRVVLYEAGRTPRSANALFEGTWAESDGALRLEGAFGPTRRARRFIRASSLALSAFVVASVAVLVLPGVGPTPRYLVPFLTLLAIVGFPLAVLAMGSQREAEEARITRTVRALLMDEEERFPPPHRYADEE